MNITIEDIKIKTKILTKGNMLAQAEVIIADIVEIKGWRIMTSTKVHPRFQETIWIQPPCYRAGPTWKPIVYINDEILYSQIEEAVYNSYTEAKRHTPPTQVTNIDTPL